MLKNNLDYFHPSVIPNGRARITGFLSKDLLKILDQDGSYNVTYFDK